MKFIFNAVLSATLSVVFLIPAPAQQPSEAIAYLDAITDLTLRFDTTRMVASDPAADQWEDITDWKNWMTVENFSFGKDRGSLPMIADMRSLHPVFRDKIQTLITICNQKGIELRMVEGFRTKAKQAEYFSMGKQYTLTKGGKSKHQYGLAADLVPFVNGEPQWDNKNLWKKIGTIGESLGLRWGGRWKSLYDPAHFEWTGGVSLWQLSQGIYPTLSDTSTYPCLDDDVRLLQLAWLAWETEQATTARRP